MIPPRQRTAVVRRPMLSRPTLLILILNFEATSSADWCPHHERDNRLLECLTTRVPPFVAHAEIVACLQPCLAAAMRVIGGDGTAAAAGAAPPSILLSVARQAGTCARRTSRRAAAARRASSRAVSCARRAAATSRSAARRATSYVRRAPSPSA